jgi:hypothetical protein
MQGTFLFQLADPRVQSTLRNSKSFGEVRKPK